MPREAATSEILAILGDPRLSDEEKGRRLVEHDGFRALWMSLQACEAPDVDPEVFDALTEGLALQCMEGFRLAAEDPQQFIRVDVQPEDTFDDLMERAMAQNDALRPRENA